MNIKGQGIDENESYRKGLIYSISLLRINIHQHIKNYYLTKKNADGT